MHSYGTAHKVLITHTPPSPVTFEPQQSNFPKMITQNKVQAEAYVSQVTTELRSLDMLNQDWGHVLNSAPVAIGILGECMIVASMRKASFIQLEGPNLAYVYIYVFIHRLDFSQITNRPLHGDPVFRYQQTL